MFSFIGKSAILVTGLLCQLSQSKAHSVPYPRLPVVCQEHSVFVSYLSTHCSCPVLRHFHIVQRNLWKTQYRVSDFHSRFMTRLLSIIKFSNNSQFCKYVRIIISFSPCVEIIPTIGRYTLVSIMHGCCCVSNIMPNEREMHVSHTRFTTKICLTGFVNILYICDDKISV